MNTMDVLCDSAMRGREPGSQFVHSSKEASRRWCKMMVQNIVEVIQFLMPPAACNGES
jgi:hypothetical protein